METKRLFQKINEIEMPEDMEKRIIDNCYDKMEESIMSKDKKNKIFKKPMVAVASIMACLCLVGLPVLAAIGKQEGFFKDIIRWDGAVIGTSYEQATDEIIVSVISTSGELAVLVEMVNPNIAPYMTFEALGIEDYGIVDANGRVVIEGNATEAAEIVEGKASIAISISELPQGDYKLVVNRFVGSAKADQPLALNGTWECEFSR